MKEFKLKTYEDLEEHLLATMDSFSDQVCESNSGITKEYFWNLCMGICLKETNKKVELNDLIRKNVIHEFPEYSRCDYVFPEIKDDSDIFSDFFDSKKSDSIVVNEVNN